MALFDRLVLGSDKRIAVHTFMAAIAEYGRGEIAQAALVKHWALDAGEEAELRTFFLDKQDAKTKTPVDSTREYSDVVHDILILSESNFEGYASAGEIESRLKALL